VAQGQKTGIFHFWNEVIRSVHGYSRATHWRFRSVDAARAWLAQKRVPSFLYGNSELGDTWATVMEEAFPMEIGSMEVKEALMSRSSLPLDQIVDLKTIGA
jgi:viroplasmin and RNaseH domain-containing protein